MSDYERARLNMVQNQLRPSEVDDPNILEAMGSVPRERFLPRSLRGVAYSDEDIELPDRRYLIEPLALARMLQVGLPQAGEVAMVIGCQTGYVAAVLAKLTTTVFVILPDQPMIDLVEEPLAELGCDNVITQLQGDDLGFPAQAPFDFILLGGGVDDVPQALLDQLADQGRLVCILREGHVGRVAVYRRFGQAVGKLTPFDANTPRMLNLVPEPAFQF